MNRKRLKLYPPFLCVFMLLGACSEEGDILGLGQETVVEEGQGENTETGGTGETPVAPPIEELVVEGEPSPESKLDFCESEGKNTVTVADINNIINQNCAGCHSPGSESRFVVEALEEGQNPADKAEYWDTIKSSVFTDFMPPGNPVKDEDKHTLNSWFQQINPVACNKTATKAMQRLTNYEYEQSISDILGINNNYNELLTSEPESHGFKGIATLQTSSLETVEAYLLASETIVNEFFESQDINPKFAAITGCPAEQEGQDACLVTIASNLLPQAFRRPVSEAEINALVNLGKTGTDRNDSVRKMLMFTFNSPNFVYRVESTGNNANGEAQLVNDYELATRLSYFLWGSAPDAELYQLAAEGKLQDTETLLAQTERMLNDRKAISFSENFALQWLQLDRLKLINQLPENIINDMYDETKLFLQDILATNQPITNILSNADSFITQALAEHYGESTGAVDGAFAKTTLTKRKGLLNHGSFLVMTSNVDKTSPVQRGKWVLENLLCSAPPPPPDDLEVELGDVDFTLPVKQRLAEHSKNPACGACHVIMDQIGFGLESFSPLAQLRTTENGHPVDPSGTLPRGGAFKDHNGMIDLLVKNEQFPSCFTEKLLTFSSGKFGGVVEEVAIKKILDQNREGNFKVRDVIKTIVTSDYFRYRIGE